MMGLQKMAILILNGQVKPPEIASVLVGRILVAFVYNPKLHPVREGRGHPGQVEEAEPDTLEEALLATLTVIPLLNARAEVQLAPRARVSLPEIITDA